MEDDNNNEDNEAKIENVKITLIGDSGVGKTCIILRYTNKEFNENQNTTRGANYCPKILKIKDKDLRLDIWDTAGQEQYRSLGNYFYRDSYVVILVYDISNKQSFENLKNLWFKDLKTFGERYTVLAIVGNKSDLFEEEEVPEDEARKFAEEQEAIFMLVSAKNGDNINLLFTTLISKYLGPEFHFLIEEKNKEAEENIKIDKKAVEATEQKIKEEKKKGCC